MQQYVTGLFAGIFKFLVQIFLLHPNCFNFLLTFGVLPCTPLAMVKILEHVGAYDHSKPVGQQLVGKTAIVYNRSEVVGRPLGAMLANDGATVYSVDITGMLIFTKGRVAGTIKVEETEVTAEEALAKATIVVCGVPSKNFSLPASGIRPDAICVNFSQFANFGEGIAERVEKYVPVIGKVTISMLERNLLRLHANFHATPPPPANFAGGAGTWKRGVRRLSKEGARTVAEHSNLVVIAAAVLAGAAIAVLARGR